MKLNLHFRCRASSDCRGFVVDYDRGRCFAVLDDFNELDGDGEHELLTSTGKVTFYRKTCLRAPQACEKAWLFDRVPGYELAGYDAEVASGVASRESCQELCLLADSLTCRSAEYLRNASICRLSSETRRTQPAAYRASPEDVDYMENQCASVKRGENQCDYVEYENQDLGFADLQTRAESFESCGQRCDDVRAFQCRSFTFSPDDGICWLSGEDTLSAGPNALTTSVGYRYAQRAPCIDRE